MKYKKRRLFILFTLFFVLTFVFVRFSFRYATNADDIEIVLSVVDYVYNELNENEVYYGEHIKTCGRCNYELLEGHSMVLIGMTGRMKCVKCGYISNSGGNPGIESKGDGCL